MPDDVIFLDCTRMTPDGGTVIGANIPGTPGALFIKNLVPQPGPGRCAVPHLPDTVALTTSNGDDHFIAQAMKLAPNLIYSAGEEYAAVWDLTAETYTRIAGPLAYTSGSNPAWQIVEFGNNAILLPNDTSAAIAPQIRIDHTGSCVDLFTSTAKPLARCMAVVRSHLFLGDCLYSSARHSQRVWWSARDNPRDFDPAVSTRCGFVDLIDGYGTVRAIVGGTNAIIFKDDAIHRMDFVGGETVWEQQLLATGVGCVSPHALVELAGNIYFRSHDGFYVLENRSTVRPIGKEDVWVSWCANVEGPWVSAGYRTGATSAKWQAFAMRGNGVVVFRHGNASDAAAGGDTLFCYHPDTDRWSVARGEITDHEWYFETTFRTRFAHEVSRSVDILALPRPGIDTMSLRIVGGESQILEFDVTAGGQPNVGDATIEVVSKCLEIPAPRRVVAVRPKIALAQSAEREDLFPITSVRIRYTDAPWGEVRNAPTYGDTWTTSLARDSDGWHFFDPTSAAFVQVSWELAGDEGGGHLGALQAFYGFEIKLSALPEGSARDTRP